MQVQISINAVLFIFLTTADVAFRLPDWAAGEIQVWPRDGVTGVLAKVESQVLFYKVAPVA